MESNEVNDADQLTITRLFEQQVARTPDAIAIISGREQLTYRNLDHKSNQLARHLQSLGVGKETLVGVLMNRSAELVVALLAILKADGAYVPLDPGYPRERISIVIEDSRTAVILSTERARQNLSATAARITLVDAEAAEIAKHDPGPVVSTATPSNLAYVIYTSGSTGRPKGVMVEHGNVASFFFAMDDVIGTEPGVWLAVTSISFDISVLELLWTLTHGFRVILHGDEGMHTIPSEIVRHSVTHLQLTPSLAHMLAIDTQSLASLGSLKKLLIGGEALPASLVKSLRPVVRGEIYNMYGPTETTIWSTAYPIPNARESQTYIPIGKTLSNTQVQVLDSELRPVLAGDVGELFIGGSGVVRGYWQRPELTAERFLPDPSSSGGRNYRTGDVVRLLPDGNLEFLGRTDFQVKIRGFRIELGEIEGTLEQHPAVQQAVVIAHEHEPGDKRLIAYIVLRKGEVASPALLRAALECKLPGYMMPSRFVVLDHLPLTANGKIDRNALPAPSSSSDSSDERLRSETERIIANIWAEALGLDHVGLHDNFFDLGATSLMIPEVQIELQRTLSREISLVDVFEFHTVSGLAGHLIGDPAAAPRSSNRVQRRLAARYIQGSR